MKIYIALITLIFSFPIFASNDLTGKNIVCSKINKNKDLYIVGYEFSPNNEVSIFTYDNVNQGFKNLSQINWTYRTTLSKIKVYEVFDDNSLSNFYYEIDRATLEVTWGNLTSKKTNFKGNSDECSVYANELIYNNLNKNLFKLKKELTKNNKI